VSLEMDRTLVDEQIGDAAYFLMTDHLGTVRDLVKDDGTYAGHVKYHVFGGQYANTLAVQTAFAFTGAMFDVETGLQYQRARYYDPAAGRWISEDPIGFAAGDTNTARYVHNNSTNGGDPSGLQEFGSVEGVGESVLLYDKWAAQIAADPLVVNLRITVLCDSKFSEADIKAHVAEASRIWSQKHSNISFRILSFEKKSDRQQCVNYLWDRNKRDTPSLVDIHQEFWMYHSRLHRATDRYFLNDAINVLYVPYIRGVGKTFEAGVFGFTVMSDLADGRILAHGLGHNLLETLDHTFLPRQLMNGGDNLFPGTIIHADDGMKARSNIILHRYGVVSFITPQNVQRFPVTVDQED
jgi:RHS repeat-associated protein